MATLTWLGVPGDEHAWRAIGFDVDDGDIHIGQVCCSPSDTPAWGFDALHTDPADLGVNTGARPVTGAAEHPCGVSKIDHIVYSVPDLDKGVAALTAVLGIEPRRRFHPRGPDGPEMAFYRVGEGFIEVVGARTSAEPPALIGLALWSPDLDSTVASIRALGGPISDPKPAVQGGRIASIWHGHLNWGLAIMGP